MKEVLYTIPLNDALGLGGECPFCHIEKEIEQDLLDFVLGSGSSYMEADVREMTDKEGFCRPLAGVKTHSHTGTETFPNVSERRAAVCFSR